MTSAGEEKVLVVPTKIFHQAGLFQGFCAEVAHYLPLLLDPAHLQFIPRTSAENDPNYKQIIPYVVFRWNGQVFHYQRGQKGTEQRLRSLRSLGVGGHINAEDAPEADPYRTGMEREIEEEVHLDSPYQETCVGLINDDQTSVGQVHLGIVHVFDLDQPRVTIKEKELLQAGFAPLAQLRQEREQFETWSQFLLAESILGAAC